MWNIRNLTVSDVPGSELNEFFTKSTEYYLSNLLATTNDPISYMYQTRTCKVIKFQEVSKNIVTDFNSNSTRDIYELYTSTVD